MCHGRDGAVGSSRVDNLTEDRLLKIAAYDTIDKGGAFE